MGNGDGDITSFASTNDLGHKDGPIGGGHTPRRAKGRRRERAVRLQEGPRNRESVSDTEASEPLRPPEGGKATMLGVASAFNLVRKVSDKMASKKQGRCTISKYLCILASLSPS
jgi:hypothetical protein